MSENSSSDPAAAQNAAKTVDPREAPRSPIAGCLILIIIAVVVLTVISFAVWSFRQQTMNFGEFTEETEKKTALLPVPTEDSLTPRLQAFAKKIDANEEADLRLSANDLNEIVARYDDLEPLRGTLFVQTIEGGLLKGDFAVPLASTKDLPEAVTTVLDLGRRDHYLQATFTGGLILSDGIPFLRFDELKSSRGEVPDPVTQAFSPLRLLPEEPAQAATMAKLTGLEIENGVVVASFSPEATPPSGRAEGEKMADQARKLVAVGALIFLLTFILFIILLAKRRRAKNERLAGQQNK